ncbi:MAG: symmetrical bis(5'-nucleosyl)-tetraphosphatase [Xanthomonadales bacterium]|nr:symmetrical bis(5'-nucleosyl)-tetraphosphatase [Xanthomonadales bacterium]
MTVYAIGDVQGCYDPLMRLLDRLAFDPAGDRLWFCGDLVNRGGQSLQVLRALYPIRESVVSVLGNHDLFLLAHAAGVARGKASAELDEVVEAHDADALLGWLRSLPLVHATDEFLLVHAGLFPGWGVDQALALSAAIQQALASRHGKDLLAQLKKSAPVWQESLNGDARLRSAISYLTRIRFCDPAGQISTGDKGPPGTQADGFHPWFQVPARRAIDQTVIFGHWASLGYYRGHGVVALDTGCVWGGALTAVDLARLDRPIQVAAR